MLISNWSRQPIVLRAFTLAVASVAAEGSSFADDWVQFRGPGGVSVAFDETLPASFDESTNVAWKTDLPAKGASSPIVVGNQVVVTCSGGDNQDQLYAVSLDAQSGKILWSQKFWATGRTLCHPMSANAAPTPTSDGKRIYVFYSSNDLACLDLGGNLVWYRGLAVDHPKAGNDAGMAASPVVHDGIVVVQIESQNDSFAMALHASTGKTLWSVPRDRIDGWSSPLLLTSDESPALVVLQSPKKFSALRLNTGETVFEAEGECAAIASSAVADGRLYVPMDGLTAYSVSGAGKFEKIWNSTQIPATAASSVIHEGNIYALNRAGVLTRYGIDDGQPEAKVRVGGVHWCTPLIAGNYMYFFAQDGTARVIQLGEEMKLVHEYDFGDEIFLGSPAVSRGAMYIRSDKSIWKITETSDSSS
jgi:outer membrane protein assembly factor BamB